MDPKLLKFINAIYLIPVVFGLIEVTGQWISDSIGPLTNPTFQSVMLLSISGMLMNHIYKPKEKPESDAN
jgi:hypothetical protein